jgi:hypothetical protein
MKKRREIMTAVLALFVVGLMASPVLAEREYRPTLVGTTRWVAVYEPETFIDTPYQTTTVSEETEEYGIIEGTFDTAGGIVDKTAEVAGETGGGILTWVGDVAGAAGAIVGGTLDFLFGGWGCPA